MTAFRHIIRGLLLALALVAEVRAAAPTAEVFRGGKVQWARLQTASPYWDRHSERDVMMLKLMRSSTSLNIEDVLRAANVANLEEMCEYPFLFSENIAVLSDKEARNLAEYLRRGGFILIDACVNTGVTPDPKVFFENQVKLLRKHFPQLRVVALEEKHEIFSIYFAMKDRPPQTRNPRNNNWVDGPITFPLRAIFSGDRMIGVIAVNGFQCGWAGWGGPQNSVNCIQMVSNIYVYAMTR
jgi:hypothetical protein